MTEATAKLVMVAAQTAIMSGKCSRCGKDIDAPSTLCPYCRQDIQYE